MRARIFISLALYLLALLLPLSGLPRLLWFLTTYAIIGWDVLWRAARNILGGQVFDENFLVAIATIGAFALGDYK